MRRIILSCLFATAWGSVPGAAASREEMPPSLAEAFEAARLTVESDGSGYRAFNPKQKLHLRFDDAAASVRAEEATVRLRLSGWGRAGRLASPDTAVVSVKGNRVEYRRDAVTEWYVNDGRGLEQGFTVTARPAGEGPLEVALKMEGGLIPRLESEKSLVLQRDGTAVLRYSGLKAWDAAGRVLASRMEVEGRALRLVVDDGSAQYPLTIDPYLEQAKLTPSDSAADDNFGTAVAISDDTAVIGAIGDNTNGISSGSAYVFVRSGNTWTQQAKLTASDATEYDQFGWSVAVSGDTAVIGSFRGIDAGTDSGAVYVFVRSGNTWTEQTKLSASDDSAGDWFGYSVAVSGDTAVVGANFGDGMTADSGAAYVFVRSGNTWSEQVKLTASDSAEYDQFGYSVAISEDTVVIGAYVDNDKGLQSGSAYVFLRSGSTWTEQAKLTASDGAAGDYFGYSVAVSGDTVVIGAYKDDDKGRDSGSAYVFLRSGGIWVEQAKLIASDGNSSDNFGYSVAVSGDTTVIGAWLGEGLRPGTGTAYVFVRNGTTWTAQTKLAASQATDSLGFSVAMSGNTVVIGDVFVDEGRGSAYAYTLPMTCTLLIDGAYRNSTLTVSYTIGNTMPRATQGWLVSGAGVTPLWARQIGIVDPPQTDSASILDFPPIGLIGVIGIISENDKAVCADFRRLNAFGPVD